MDFEQKFLEELEKYKRKRSLSALADSSGVGQSDLSRVFSKGQKLKIENIAKPACLQSVIFFYQNICVSANITIDLICLHAYIVFANGGDCPVKVSQSWLRSNHKGQPRRHCLMSSEPPNHAEPQS